ncbi:MAG: adenylyltransferase/cytidyltransferase family protein [Muribaculum sp.]|nr:adenylyltransferase/cytidyltransferase family protein [Muribaculum sp.]
MEKISNLETSGKNKRVFVSGCYDMLHSGHVAFFKEASKYGDLYVGIGSDKTIHELKHRKTVYSEKERLYMVKSIRYVTDAYVNSGSGMLDFLDTLDAVNPDIFVVNSDGGSEDKRKMCQEKGIEYIVLERIPEDGLDARSTTSLRQNVKCHIPYRVDIAGTWIDQPYVSEHGSGWALTVSIEPNHEFIERGGMSTSTRNAAKKVWPYELPDYNEEMMARLLFCFENDPENKGHISGAQDAIGICMSGLNRHYYDGHYWPSKIETCHDEDVLRWLENHICLVEMFPRRPGCSVVEGKDINPTKVKDLTSAADRCWDAIMQKDLHRFAEAFKDSFNAQVAMFPAMMQPGVQDFIDQWKDKALAWKMLGAGGGGHLALVVDEMPEEGVIPIKIRRRY